MEERLGDLFKEAFLAKSDAIDYLFIYFQKNFNAKEFKFESSELINICIKWVIFIILFLIGIKLIYMFVLNAIVDSYINTIDVAPLIQNLVDSNINYSTPIRELLPMFLINFLNFFVSFLKSIHLNCIFFNKIRHKISIC